MGYSSKVTISRKKHKPFARLATRDLRMIAHRVAHDPVWRWAQKRKHMKPGPVQASLIDALRGLQERFGGWLAKLLPIGWSGPASVPPAFPPVNGIRMTEGIKMYNFVLDERRILSRIREVSDSWKTNHMFKP